MSVIQKIQEKYAKLMAVIIAIALLTFVVMLAFENGGSLFQSGPSTTVGTINGKKINAIAFNKTIDQQEASMQQQGYPSGAATRQMAIENAWKNIADHHLTVTGGPWGGIGKHKECFNTKNYWAPYGYVETCSTMSWIQLNKMLLQLTGDSKYAEEVERSAYNALIGAQFANGQDWSYHIFSNGKKHVANYNDCCPSSGVLALQEIPAMVYSLRGNGIALNIFSASEASMIVNGQAIRISQQTQYPFDGKINLTISSQKTSTLYQDTGMGFRHKHHH